MKFQSKTEEQIKIERLIPDGIYPFTVSNAEAKTSKAGNEMIMLEMVIYMPDGSRREITDFLMEKMLYKLLHFCRETGLGALYEQGTLEAHDCEGKDGYVKIGSQTRRDNGELQNQVKDYVGKPEANASASRSGPTDAQLENRTEEAGDVPW